MNESEIFINQIGYKLSDDKNVFVSKSAKGDSKEFSVCNKADGQVVYTGALIAAPNDELSGERYFTGDFSSIKTTGEYYVCVGSFPNDDTCADIHYSSVCDGQQIASYKHGFRTVISGACDRIRNISTKAGIYAASQRS